MIIGSNIMRYDSLPSTNTLANRLVKEGEPVEGTVIVAGYQTAGKGQGNNVWESENSKNLLLSVILYPEKISPENQIFITMFVSLAICDFIDSIFPGSKIKKPNDIYFGKDKMAGILIENGIIDGMMKSSVIGIGLNVNQTVFAPEIPNAVSLKMVTGTEHNIDSCLRRLLSALDSRYFDLLYGDQEALEREYTERLM